MSHFTVLVAGDDLEDQLAPFDENLEMDEYVAEDVSEEDIQNFMDCCLKEGDISPEMSFDEAYGLKGEDWNGSRWRKNSDGIWQDWSTYNPNSKWDWYEVGGRWSGTLLLHNGDSANTARVYNIDWDKMQEKRYNELKDNYEVFHRYYDADTFVVESGMAEKYDEWCGRNEKVKSVIKNYNEFARIEKAFNEMDWFMWSLEDAKDFITKTLDEYCLVHALTYAYIDSDGNWCQRGEMGWWGMDDKEKGTSNYDTAWWDFVASLDYNKTVYIVDCHI